MHCIIGVLYKDKTLHTVNYYHDAQEKHTTKTLLNHYKRLPKIEELLAHGELYDLQPQVEPDGEHTYKTPEQGVCGFYARDMWHEDPDYCDRAMETWESMSDFLPCMKHGYFSYVCLFSEFTNKWYIGKYCNEKFTLKLIK